jgi:NitT/TauT family transport system substrate-binding protein
MFKNLTTGFKLFLLIVIVGGVSAAIYFGGGLKKNAKDKSSTGSETKKTISNLFGSNKPDLTVVVNTWGGFAPLAYLNGGSLEPNKESRIYKEYCIKLAIKICDVFDDSRNTFKSGNGDIVYTTYDALPVEMGAGSTMVQYGAEGFLQVDWSRGGDLIVVRKGINNVADLKGKTVAVAEGTASNSLLIKTLDANQLTMSDVVLKKVTDGIEAAKLFKAGAVDAAVVWTPDDGDCLAAIPGSKVLVGTKSAPFIIADGLLATKTFIEENQDLLSKFSTAWLKINGEINGSETTKLEAAKAFAKAFNVDEGFALNGLDKVRLTTLGDNLNFFGLNPQYVGVTGEQLYSKMSIVYSDLKLTSKPVAWRSVSNTSVIEALSNEGKLTGPSQEAEASIKFTPATAEVKTKGAMSSKKVSINFTTGAYVLTDDNKAIIDREFVSLSKDFAGLRVRIEGNTDAVGDPGFNLSLSTKRAQAVADYLIKEYKFDPNRFIIQGNGSRQAIADGVTTANENYRRTDFQFIANE